MQYHLSADVYNTIPVHDRCIEKSCSNILSFMTINCFKYNAFLRMAGCILQSHSGGLQSWLALQSWTENLIKWVAALRQISKLSNNSRQDRTTQHRKTTQLNLKSHAERSLCHFFAWSQQILDIPAPRARRQRRKECRRPLRERQTVFFLQYLYILTTTWSRTVKTPTSKLLASMSSSENWPSSPPKLSDPE